MPIRVTMQNDWGEWRFSVGQYEMRYPGDPFITGVIFADGEQAQVEWVERHGWHHDTGIEPRAVRYYVPMVISIYHGAKSYCELCDLIDIENVIWATHAEAYAATKRHEP